jgi:flagellar hook-associated protein 2
MSSTIFSGNSRYATDFQSVIDRAVAIASLPKTQMQNALTSLQGESTALSGLDTRFSSLQSAVSALETATGSSSLYSTVSDDTAARATVGAGAFEGNYSLQITDLGAYSSVMSSSGTAVTDPGSGGISSSKAYTLTVGSRQLDITAASSSLNDLVAAINSQAGSEVGATLVNVGSGTADYRLSLETKHLGSFALQLNDGTKDLLDTAATPDTSLVDGWKAKYKVGNSAELESDSRTITLSSGLTVEFQEETTSPLTINVSRNAAVISGALSSFISAYNATVDELDKHHGKNGGALTGQSIVNSLSRSLTELTAYSGSGTVGSLADLGVTLGKDGKLSFDSSTFSSATSEGLTAAFEFLGSQDGSGFLKTAADVLNGIEDATGGTLKSAISSTTSSLSTQDKRISDEQERIDAMQERMQAQIAASDALIAQLEQQVTYFTNLFSAMQSSSGSSN